MVIGCICLLQPLNNCLYIVDILSSGYSLESACMCMSASVVHAYGS